MTELDPNSAWVTLKTAYQGTGPVLRQQLYLQLHQLKLEQFKNNLVAFISKFQAINDQLKSVGSIIAEEDLKILLISAISKQYPIWAERQRSNLRKENPPTTTELINDILDERHGIYGTNTTNNSNLQYSTDGDVIMQDAYFVKKSNKLRNNNYSYYNNRNNYNKPKTNYTPNYNNNNNYKNNYNNNSYNKSNYNKPQNTPNSNKWNNNKYNNNNNKTNKSYNSNNYNNSNRRNNDKNNRKAAFPIINGNESNDYNFAAFNEIINTTVYNNNIKNNDIKDWWLYDTGSSVHISNNKSSFTNLRYDNEIEPILTGKGYIKPSGIGTVKLPIIENSDLTTIKLNNALYIPDFPINLVSGQKHYQNGGSISSNKLLDNKGNRITEFDFENSGFFLRLKNKIRPKLSLLSIKNTIGNQVFNTTNTTILWHYKLGHPSYNALIRTAKTTTGIPIDKLKESDLTCESCIISKNTRKQSKISHNRAENPLERICIDTVALPTTSYTGFNYSVIFTDDYTNYRWIQHSKKKSEIYDILLQQFEYYKNQYNQYPKKIRIDNGTEFRTNLDLPIFLKNKGIILELSTAYTPEQNGIAERSNRTIFDKARSIIQAYKIPIYLWEFILNSTVELINKTANKRLGITLY